MTINKAWIISRLKEPSTWRGFVMLLTAGGVQIQPEMIEVIVSGGLALAGVLGVVTADRADEQANG